MHTHRSTARTTRLIKCECAQCGYIARVSLKWIQGSGVPRCPQHGSMPAVLPESGRSTPPGTHGRRNLKAATADPPD